MWKKLGIVFEPDSQFDWMRSHACVPTALPIGQDIIRVYFAPRNQKGQSIPVYIDVSAENPTEIISISNGPILELGRRGTFDDGGIMPCSASWNGDKVHLYYVGWNPSVSVPYRNSVGLAVSEDGGTTFSRLFEGPVVDRTLHEPFFTASPYAKQVRPDNWMMWYASSTGFLMVNDKPEPLYEIKFAQSKDGIHWERPNITCIPPSRPDECTARPTVLYDGTIFKMWYTYRGSFDYRDGQDAYRIGYAESDDGKRWERKDDKVGIQPSDSGWDSTMQTYPDVIQTDYGTYLFYNGNGFGATGIGVAIWQNDSAQ